MLPTAKNKFKTLLNKVPIINSVAADIHIKFDSLKGDICILNRKGVIKIIYDFNLKVKWEGSFKKDENNEVKGKGNMTFDVDIEGEYKIRVNLDNDNPDNSIFKDIINSEGKSTLIQIVDKVINDLKEETNNLQNQMKESNNNVLRSSKGTSAFGVKVSEDSTQVTLNDRAYAIVRQIIEFELVPPNDLYEIILNFHNLTNNMDTQKIQVEGTFHLFEGSVIGKLKEAVPYSKIAQFWRCSNWPENHYSDVLVQLEPTENGTKLTLYQKSVPKIEFSSTYSVWEEYWSKIKSLFGYNYKILKINL
jgi:activator of HSP90 ATPase